MSLTINNTSYIDDLDLWQASLSSLPDLDYPNLSYKEQDKGRHFCTDENALNQVKDSFDTSVIDTKISVPYYIHLEIIKNEPGFNLIPHYDNSNMLGVIIINLIDSKTSTEFYNNQNVKIGQAPTSLSKGIMYLNNFDFKHGYNNTTNNNRYIAICIIYKK